MQGFRRFGFVSPLLQSALRFWFGGGGHMPSVGGVAPGGQAGLSVPR